GLTVLNVIIDGGSSENIISRDIVTRLKLTPKKHPEPYKIGWIKAVGEVRVTEQCEVLFSMGKYKDTVLFDIVDMDAYHVLLGRPWQFEMWCIKESKIPTPFQKMVTSSHYVLIRIKFKQQQPK
ncbi:putative receptor protein kinase ZmPK1, partial [Tanacetum coccineum]